jgi:hypothetical protein
VVGCPAWHERNTEEKQRNVARASRLGLEDLLGLECEEGMFTMNTCRTNAPTRTDAESPNGTANPEASQGVRCRRMRADGARVLGCAESRRDPFLEGRRAAWNHPPGFQNHRATVRPIARIGP